MRANQNFWRGVDVACAGLVAAVISIGANVAFASIPGAANIDPLTAAVFTSSGYLMCLMRAPGGQRRKRDYWVNRFRVAAMVPGFFEEKVSTYDCRELAELLEQ